MTAAEEIEAHRRREMGLRDRLPGERCPQACRTIGQYAMPGWELLRGPGALKRPDGHLYAAFLAWPAQHKLPAGRLLRSPFPHCTVQDLLWLAWDGAAQPQGGVSGPDWCRGLIRLLQETPEGIEAEIVLWTLAREG